MPKGIKNTEAFVNAIEEALKLISDPEALGQNSSLAAPYFLGDWLSASHHPERPFERGRALQTLLHESAAQLDVEIQQVLRVGYFDRDPHANYVGVSQRLGYATATYMRRRKEAVQALAQSVARLARPQLRTESPRHKTIIGRSDIFQSVLRDLRQGKTVAITGGSGFGKTALGIAIHEAWEKGRVFWFTLRPGLNDDLSNMAFALGYFLRSCEATHAWRYLVAQQDGKLDTSKFVGLIRQDLANLSGSPILICVDEADLLDVANDEHTRMLHLIEELRQLMPALMIGQKLVLLPDQHIALAGLQQAETVQLLATQGVVLHASEIARLHQLSAGNPAILILFAALIQSGESAHDALYRIPQVPTVEVLVQRVWQHLSEDACALLKALVVYTSPCPEDEWHEFQPILDDLVAKQLVVSDKVFGLSVAPFLRHAITLQIADDREATMLHLNAAHVFETRSLFTAAAHHYLAAAQPERAIWVWFQNQNLEIERGQASNALKLFKQIQPESLANDSDKQALLLLRSRQLFHTGSGVKILEELNQTRWSYAKPASVLAQRLRGRAFQMLEQTDQALAAYRQSLAELGSVPEALRADLFTKVGHLLMWQKQNPQAAMAEVLKAQFEVDNLRGAVEERLGDYVAAHVSYSRALSIAPQLENSRSALSLIHSKLGDLYWKQRRITEAISHLTQAQSLFDELGDAQNRLMNKISLSAAYIIAEKYEDAFTVATSDFELANNLRIPYLIAGLASNAAEACFYLNQYAKAEELVHLSLSTENEYWRSYALTVQGWVHQYQGQFTLALQFLQAALEAARDSQDLYQTAVILRSLGKVHTDLKNYHEGKMANQEARRIFEKLKLTHEVEKIPHLDA